MQTTFQHEKAMFRADPALRNFLDRSPFTLQQNQRRVTMDCTASGYRVAVEFQATALPEDQEVSVPFDVTVHREHISLVFSCYRLQEQLHIESLRHSGQVYFGPDFGTLELQQRRFWAEFLQTLGVDDELAEFVEAYALEAEHKLYIQWLQDAKAVLDTSKDR